MISKAKPTVEVRAPQISGLPATAFDRRWHIALDILDRDVSCCQKTLHNFRVLLRQHDKARQLFEGLTDSLPVFDQHAIGPNLEQLDRSQLGAFLHHSCLPFRGA